MRSFDAGLVSFADDGVALASPRLDAIARKVLGLDTAPTVKGLRDAHRANLALHRAPGGMGILKAARTHGVGTAVAQRIKRETASA
jgi:hypothetical protein